MNQLDVENIAKSQKAIFDVLLAKKCPHCHDTGTCYEQNGPDDVNAEICNCQF